jgi:hypothetical protein
MGNVKMHHFGVALVITPFTTATLMGQGTRSAKSPSLSDMLPLTFEASGRVAGVDLPGLRPECSRESDRQIAPSTATIAQGCLLGADCRWWP